jgi:hypothetical protein
LEDQQAVYEAAQYLLSPAQGFIAVARAKQILENGPRGTAEDFLERDTVTDDGVAAADDFFDNEVDMSQDPIPAMPPALQRPARQFKSFLKQIRDIALQVPFLHDLAAMVKGTMESVQTYSDLMAQKGALKRDLELKVQEILNQFGQLTDKQQHIAQQFMHDSTFEGKWGYAPTWRDDVTVDPVFRTRWAQLDKPVKALVDAVFKHGYETLKAKRDEINTEVTAEYDMQLKVARENNEPEAVVNAILTSRKEALQKNGTFLTNVTGPYVSLRRFGDFVVVWESQAMKQAKADKDDKRVEALMSNPDHYLVVFADTDARASEIVDEWSAKGRTGADHFKKANWYNSLGEMPFMTMQRMKASLMDKENTAINRALNRMLTDTYVQMLMDGSARKSEMARKLVGGYEPQDIMRGFALQGDADAHFLSALKMNSKVMESLNDIRKEATHGTKGTRDQRNRVLNEIEARHQAMFDYQPTPVQDALMSVNSVWFLLMSPAYYFQNLTQPFMMSHPMMAATHGWNKSFSLLTEAYRELGHSGMLSDMVKNFNSNTGEVALDMGRIKNKVGSEKAMLESLRKFGLIDIGMDSDLGYMRQTNPIGAVMGKVTHKLGLIARNAEIINRVSTAVAAYRLTYGKTAGTAEQKHEEATAYARKVVEQTHGNYAGYNAPGFMMPGRYQGVPVKLLTQFRKFQIIQISMLARQFHTAFFNKNVPPPEQAAARATLKFIFAHYGVLAGALGLPAANLLGMALAGGGDDEPKDAEYRARKALADAGLSKEVIDLLLHGAPTAFGMNLTNRLGMGNTFSVLPFTDVDLTKKQGMAELSLALMGPTGALAGKFADGMGLIGKGDVWKGYEMLMPKGIGDGMKAMRFASEGVTNRKNDVLLTPEEISFASIMMQSVGLPSEQLMHRQWQQGVAIEFDKHLKDTAAELKHRYTAAAREGDRTEMKAITAEWSALQRAYWKHGMKAPMMSDLTTAPVDQRKRELKTVNGLQYTNASRSFITELTEQ